MTTVMVILAHDQGSMAGLAVLLFAVVGVVAVTPITAPINWLKGKRRTAIALSLVAVITGLAWLSNERVFLVEPIVGLASPIALFGLITAMGIAKPGSWWFGRYSARKKERAVEAFGTAAGRRRRARRAGLALLSVAGGLILGVVAITGIEDLLTTSHDELYTRVSLYINDPDGDEIDRILTRLSGEGISIHHEQRSTDLGARSAELLTGPYLGCFQWSALDRVELTITPREHEAVNAALERIAPIAGLVAAESELGDPRSILGVSGIPDCDAEDVAAILDVHSSDEERSRLAADIRAIDGVVAVEQPVWGRDQERYEEFPGLVACFAPREMRVWVAESQADIIPSLIARIEREPIVWAAASYYVEEEEMPEEFFHDENSLNCERHTIEVSLAGDISDSEAASLIAAARRVPGVVNVELWRFSEIECAEGDSCLSAGLSVVRGETDNASFRAIASALCGKPGVLGIDVWWDQVASPCPKPWLEVRTEGKKALESVDEIASESPLVFNIRVSEPYVDSVAETVVGSRNPDICGYEIEHLWRLYMELAPGDEKAISALVSELEQVDGVRAIVGTAVGTLGTEPETCGHPSLWYHLEPGASDADRKAIIELLAAEPSLLAADLLKERSNVGTENGVVDTGWSGTIYFKEYDVEVARALKARLEVLEGVAHVEVIEYEEEWVP